MTSPVIMTKARWMRSAVQPQHSPDNLGGHQGPNHCPRLKGCWGGLRLKLPYNIKPSTLKSISGYPAFRL